MAYVGVRGVGHVLAFCDERKTNRNRVALRTGHGVKLTLRSGDAIMFNERRMQMVETKRMRQEHLHDKGAASDENPRTHLTEEMTPDEDARYRRAQAALASGDGGKALAKFDADTDDKFRADKDTEDEQPFASTTTKPAAGVQPPKTVENQAGQSDDTTKH